MTEQVCQRKRCTNILTGKQEKWCSRQCAKAAENLRRYHRKKAEVAAFRDWAVGEVRHG